MNWGEGRVTSTLVSRGEQGSSVGRGGCHSTTSLEPTETHIYSGWHKHENFPWKSLPQCLWEAHPGLLTLCIQHTMICKIFQWLSL